MLLLEVVILLGVACAALVGGRALGLPPIAAYLVAGVTAGPGGLGLVHHSDSVEQLAELGVALLLFGIGTEMTPSKLREGLGRSVTAGVVQVVVTIVAGAALFAWIGTALSPSIAVGFLVALSSTALVLKLFSDSGELGAPHARAATGILVIQDFALIPMMLLLPVLGGEGESVVAATAMALGRAALALAVILALARAVLPPLLDAAAHAAVPELFAPLALLIAFGTALAAYALGLSLPLGAFLAGLALAGTAYAHRIFAELLPLRDAFVALFFTSVGVLCVPSQALAEPAAFAAMAAAIFAKTVIVTVLVGVAWRSWRVGLMAGVALSQIGEFSFVLAREAGAGGLLAPAAEQAFLACAVASMAITPFAVAAVRGFVQRDGEEREGEPRFSGHVVVAGGGATGRAVANVLKATSIPFVVVELDAQLVRRAAREGMHLHFGDATRRALLVEVGVRECRALVVCVGEAVATRRIVTLARTLNARAPILVRAHKVDEIPELERLGASEVIPAEFEASIELFVRMLTCLGVPRHVARVQEGIIRLGNYQALRGSMTSSRLMPEIEKLIRGGIIEHAEVLEGSEAAGSTLGDVGIRERSGAAVLTLVRGENPIANPGPDEKLEVGDLVVLYGPHASIAAALEMFEPRAEDAPAMGEA